MKYILTLEFDTLEELQKYLTSSAVGENVVIAASTPAKEEDEDLDGTNSNELSIEKISPILSSKIQAGHKTEIAKKLKELGSKNLAGLDPKHYKTIYDFLNGLA